MKQFILLAVFTSLVLSCSQLGDNEFLVKGKIENGEGKTIFLSDFGPSGMFNIDSVTIEKNGSFKLKGKTSHPKFYVLRISPNEYITLLIDSANILEVYADAGDFVKSHKVEGSEDMVLISQLVERMNITQAKIDSLGKIYESFIGTESIDSAQKAVDDEFNRITDQQREFSKKFVETNASSMASLLALSQQIIPQRVGVFTLPEDVAYFEKVDAELFKLYPESKDVQSLHNFIAQIKTQDKQPVNSQGFGIGDVVPDISMKNPEGKTLSLYSLRGKYVLLDFWAGWCRPCRLENPYLVENYRKFKSRGFEIFQVSLDKERKQWVDAIEKDELGEWYHVSDLQFWQSAPARLYNISQIPANFLLNPKGEVIAINLRGETLGAKLAEIFM